MPGPGLLGVRTGLIQPAPQGPAPPPWGPAPPALCSPSAPCWAPAPLPPAQRPLVLSWGQPGLSPRAGPDSLTWERLRMAGTGHSRGSPWGCRSGPARRVHRSCWFLARPGGDFPGALQDPLMGLCLHPSPRATPQLPGPPAFKPLLRPCHDGQGQLHPTRPRKGNQSWLASSCQSNLGGNCFPTPRMVIN